MCIIWTIEFDALPVDFDLYDQDMPVTLLEDPVRDDRIMQQPAGRMNRRHLDSAQQEQNQNDN